MSETKSVVIQQNNGTDYDKIYPEIRDSEVNLTDDNISVWGNTLKEALPKINSRTTKIEEDNWKIGDVKISSRDSLGDKWLKTDGSSFSISDYPDLAEICYYAGYPFGTKEVTTSTVPGCAYFGRALNETNLKNPCSNYVNGYHFRFNFTVNENDSSVYTVTYYYSTDLISWESNQFDITVYGSSSVYTYFQGIGYENGYWYCSFKFNTNGSIAFVYNQDLTSSNWIRVDISSSITSDYSFYCWDGSLFFKDGNWYTYVGLNGSSIDTYCIGEIVSQDINFATPSWAKFSEYFPENIYPTGGKSINAPWVFRTDNYINIVYFTQKNGTSSSNTKGYYYCGGTIGTANNPLTVLLKNSSSDSVVSQQAIRTNSNEVYFMYYRNTDLFYVKLTPEGASTASSYFQPVTFIKDDGTYIYYAKDSNYAYIYIYTSNNPIMSDYTTTKIETSKITGLGTNFIGNAIFSDKVCWFQNTTNVNPNTVSEIKFGGILPNYTPSSSSQSSLNAFIKALE